MEAIGISGNFPLLHVVWVTVKKGLTILGHIQRCKNNKKPATTQIYLFNVNLYH